MYLGSVTGKHSGTGERKERALQDRTAIGSLEHIMNGRSVNMEARRDLRNSVIVPMLTYAGKTWAWNKNQISRVQAVEMSYLRSACGASRMDGLSNERVHECFGVCYVGDGKKCGVVEEMNRHTSKRFGMGESNMTKMVYVSEKEGGNGSGQPSVKWKDRV